MPGSVKPGAEGPGPLEALPLSLLNDYLYCPRRAALKLIEGLREGNEHTERGDIVHEHSDLAGYEVVRGVTLLRALPVWSERLGLNGKCDIVEVRCAPPQASSLAPGSGSGRVCSPKSAPGASASASGLDLAPVEFKVGRRREWVNDDVQLCAQAMCLEEMFGVAVGSGAVFHADSKRRRQVEFTAELRQLTLDTAAALHALASGPPASGGPAVPGSAVPDALPAAVFKPACKKCSLYPECLPEATSRPDRLVRAARSLFEIADPEPSTPG